MMSLSLGADEDIKADTEERDNGSPVTLQKWLGGVRDVHMQSMNCTG